MKLDLLERHLVREGTPADQRTELEEVRAEYVEALGPEAATIGPPEEFLDKY